MYECCDKTIKGCLSANISLISEELSTLVTQPIESLESTIYRMGNGLDIVCGLVCDTIQKDKIVKVNPEYIFLTPSNNFTEDVFVISNVVWNVN